MSKSKCAWSILAVVALMSCHSDTIGAPSDSVLGMETTDAAPGQSNRRLALISFYHDPVVIELPARGTTAMPVDVYVTTYSGGCIRDDTITVSVSRNRAEVAPFQQVY